MSELLTPESIDKAIQSLDHMRNYSQLGKTYDELLALNIGIKALKLLKHRSRPKVICLCGSTRFKQEFIDANVRETMRGKIVLTVGWFSHADGEVFTPTSDEKQALDELHLRKIDLADEVLVITSGKATNGLKHIGESTYNEMCYAYHHRKPIHFYPVEDALEQNWNYTASGHEESNE